MDKDRKEGMIDKAKGSIKEAVGKVSGDKKIEGEGAAQKNKGKIQNTIGGVKDTARDALKK